MNWISKMKNHLMATHHIIDEIDMYERGVNEFANELWNRASKEWRFSIEGKTCITFDDLHTVINEMGVKINGKFM